MIRLKRKDMLQYKGSQFTKMPQYKLMDQNEIQNYKSLFTNIHQVQREIDAIRNCLIQCELPHFYKNVTYEEHKKAIAKFTQLFKTLLEVKHKFENFEGF
jgi:hypothetical protein